MSGMERGGGGVQQCPREVCVGRKESTEWMNGREGGREGGKEEGRKGQAGSAHLEVVEVDAGLVAAGGNDGGLVANVGDVCAREACSRGQGGRKEEEEGDTRRQ